MELSALVSLQERWPQAEEAKKRWSHQRHQLLQQGSPVTTGSLRPSWANLTVLEKTALGSAIAQSNQTLAVWVSPEGMLCWWHSALAFLGSCLHADSVSQVLSVARVLFGSLPPHVTLHKTCLTYKIRVLSHMASGASMFVNLLRKAKICSNLQTLQMSQCLLSFTLCFVFIVLTSCSLLHLPVIPHPTLFSSYITMSFHVFMSFFFIFAFLFML